MRHGYTTGACATAVSKAALLALITKEEQETSTIHLPIGRDATFTIENAYLKKMLSAVKRLKMLVMILMRPIRHSSLAQ